MANEEKFLIRQFDLVKIKTTKHVHWLSAPPGVDPTPDGLWMVVMVVGNNLVINKGPVMCAIPPTDIIWVGTPKFVEVISNGESEDKGEDENRIQES